MSYDHTLSSAFAQYTNTFRHKNTHTREDEFWTEINIGKIGVHFVIKLTNASNDLLLSPENATTNSTINITLMIVYKHCKI